MALQGFVESEYLAAKLAALQADPAYTADWTGKTEAQLKVFLANAGFTPELHYQQYGWAEGLAPNALFNQAEYKLAKAIDMYNDGFTPGNTTYGSVPEALAAFEAAWPFDPYLHYLQYGFAEGIDPSNAFDQSAYLAAKLASLQADPETADEWADKTPEDLLAALVSIGLSPLSHYVEYGKDEGIPVTEVPPGEQVDVTTLGVPGETFILTTGIDNIVGTPNDDTILGSNSTFTVGDVIDGGAGVDTLIIANENENLTLAGRTLISIENLTIINVDPDTGSQDFNFVHKMLDTVTIDYANTEHLNYLYLDNLRADTDLVIENVIANGYSFYRNDNEVVSTLTGSVSQSNTLRNIDNSVNDNYIEFYNYAYFSAATELNLTTTVDNVITGGTTSTGSDEGIYVYNYIEMEADNAVINLTYNLSNILVPDYYSEISTYIYNGATIELADVVNVEYNIDNVDGLYLYIDPYYSGQSSDSDVVTINIGAGGLANTDGNTEIWFYAIETININVDGDAEFEDIDVYSSVDAAQTINIVANANFTVVDTFDVADDQEVTMNISGAGNVTFDLNGDNYGVTVNAGTATGILDLGVGSNGGYATILTAGSGDDIITLLNPFELNADLDAFIQVLDGGDGIDTFEIRTDYLETSQGLLNADVTDFSDAIINFERLSLTNFAGQSIDAITLGFDHVTIDGYSTGGSLMVESGATVVVTGNGTTDLEIIVDDAAAGTDDSLNLIVNGEDGITLAGLTVADVETINIASTASDPDDATPGANAVALLAGGMVTLNISGETELDLTSSLFMDLETVDAAGFDAGLTIDVSSAAQAVTITTGSGADVVVGSDYNDVITVGDGGNTVTGGLGLDIINLGSGDYVDTILYFDALESQGTKVDVINGFQVNNDLLDLSGITFTGTASYVGEANGYGAVLTSLDGGGTDAFAVLDSSTGILYIDVNADGVLDNSDMAIELTGVTELSADNFIFA